MGLPSRWATPSSEVELALRELHRESGALFTGATVVQLGLASVTWTLGEFHPLDLVLLATWGSAAVLALRRQIPAVILPWLWAGLAAVSAAALCVQVAQHELLIPFGYLLIIAAVFPPLTLFWRPVIVGGALIVLEVSALAFVTADSAVWVGYSSTDAVLQTVGALLGGSVALYFRRRSLSVMVDDTEVLETQAFTDGLTGILNRRGIDEGGRRLVERSPGTVFVLFVDVNGLKKVNDSMGHDEGDELLRGVASALRSVTRSGDLLGRWGGDEFVIVGSGDRPDPDVVEKRVLRVLATLGVTRISTMGVSVGGAGGPGSFDTLLEAADEDMYRRRANARGATPPA